MALHLRIIFVLTPIALACSWGDLDFYILVFAFVFKKPSKTIKLDRAFLERDVYSNLSLRKYHPGSLLRNLTIQRVVSSVGPSPKQVRRLL